MAKQADSTGIYELLDDQLKDSKENVELLQMMKDTYYEKEEDLQQQVAFMGAGVEVAMKSKLVILNPRHKYVTW